jgi:hypothetical protein
MGDEDGSGSCEGDVDFEVVVEWFGIMDEEELSGCVMGTREDSTC